MKTFGIWWAPWVDNSEIPGLEPTWWLQVSKIMMSTFFFVSIWELEFNDICDVDSTRYVDGLGS